MHTKQLSLFDVIKPYLDWYIRPSNDGRMQSQGHFICANCGELLECTGFKSWIMNKHECFLETSNEWRFCERCRFCGAFVGHKNYERKKNKEEAKL